MSPELTQILGLLERLNTAEIHALQTRYLPEARAKALADESRLAPIRLRESEPTFAVEPDAIQRSFNKAFVEAHAEGEGD